MAKFKVGDKARVMPHGWVSYDMEKQIGKIGTITLDDGTGFMQYRLDIGQACAPWQESCLELVEPRREFIVIRRDGSKTIAELRHDREVIKSAVATCSENDTFDFETGAKIAFDRLMGREEPKPAHAPEPPKFYTGKVVCVGFDKDSEFAYGKLIGRIGVIENGHALWHTCLTQENYTSFKDFCLRNSKGKWIEYRGEMSNV